MQSIVREKIYYFGDCMGFFRICHVIFDRRFSNFAGIPNPFFQNHRLESTLCTKNYQQNPRSSHNPGTEAENHKESNSIISIIIIIIKIKTSKRVLLNVVRRLIIRISQADHVNAPNWREFNLISLILYSLLKVG